MHHFVAYDRTGKVTRYFTTSTNEFLPKPLSRGEKFLEITDENQIETLAETRSGMARMTGTVKRGRLEAIELEPRFVGTIKLAIDAEDVDGDGVIELPADGTTAVTIRATARDTDGRVAKGDLTVRFQVTCGALSRRDVQARKGVAEVHLTSSVDTTQCTVSAASNRYEPAVAVLNFIAPEEYRELKASKKPAPVVSYENALAPPGFRPLPESPSARRGKRASSKKST